MNEEKAKFILSAYRPEHQDRDDPEFQEALEFAGKNAEVNEWFEEQLAFDRSIVSALRSVPIPENLHGNIVAGACVSAARQPAWQEWIGSPAVRALAAVIVIGIFVVVAFVPGSDAEADWKVAAIETLTELSDKRVTLDLKSRDANAIYDWLKEKDPDLASSFPVPVNEVGAYGCKGVLSKDGLVTIVCFEHDGTMFHLASFHVRDGKTDASGQEPVIEEEGKWLSATWRRGEFSHMLITSNKSVEDEGLLRVIEEFNA